MEFLHAIGWVFAMFGAALIVLPPLLIIPFFYAPTTAAGAFSTFVRRSHPGGRLWKDNRFHGTTVTFK